MNNHKLEFRYNDKIKAIIKDEEGINDADKITKIILKYNLLKDFQQSIESETRKLSRKIKDLSRQAFTDPNINMHNKNFLDHKLDVLINDLDNDGPLFSIVIFDVSEVYNNLDSDDFKFMNKNISTNLSMQTRDIDIISTMDETHFALITFTIEENSLTGYADRCKNVIATTITDFTDTEGGVKENIFYGYSISRYSDTTTSLLDRVINETRKEKVKAKV